MAYVQNNNGLTNLLRLFVAVEIPGVVAKEIEKIQKNLQSYGDLFTGTYVDPSIAHITLQFIGYVDPTILFPIKKILQNVSFSPIQARLGKVGDFGDNRTMKVIWLGVESEGIAELAYEIDKGLSLGTTKEKRPFHSHVTLARVRTVKDVEEVRKKISEIKVEPIPFVIDEFVLKQSMLSKDGPIYVDLERYYAE